MALASANRGGSNFGSLLIFIVLVFLAVIVFIGVRILPQPHAEISHALSEVEQIRACINNNGPFMKFVEVDKKTFHLLCNLPDGRIGDQIITKDKSGFIEKTSFVPKDGTWKQIYDWLLRKGATKFTGDVK